MSPVDTTLGALRHAVQPLAGSAADHAGLFEVIGGAPFVLHQVRHAFRVRITAPESLRARRVERERGLTRDAVDLNIRNFSGSSKSEPKRWAIR